MWDELECDMIFNNDFVKKSFMCFWKNCQNWLIFDKDMGKNIKYVYLFHRPWKKAK